MGSKRKLESLNVTLACRICLEQSRPNDLVSLCRCKGSLKYIHKACFVHWIDRSKSLICELCRSHYRNIVVRSKPANFLEFIQTEPEWVISLAINSIPLLYDLYFIASHSELDLVKRTPGGNPKKLSPITIKLNSVHMSIYLSLDKLNLSLKRIPITLPIEILNLCFFVRDMCARFREFKRLNRKIDVDFIWSHSLFIKLQFEAEIVYCHNNILSLRTPQGGILLSIE